MSLTIVLIAPPFAVTSMAVILAERLVYLVARGQREPRRAPTRPEWRQFPPPSPDVAAAMVSMGSTGRSRDHQMHRGQVERTGAPRRGDRQIRQFGSARRSSVSWPWSRAGDRRRDGEGSHWVARSGGLVSCAATSSSTSVRGSDPSHWLSPR
jgi:hypothetical protein